LGDSYSRSLGRRSPPVRLFLLNALFSWLQRTFGFGRGCSGFGCGVILLFIFVCVIVTQICNVDWLRLFALVQ